MPQRHAYVLEDGNLSMTAKIIHLHPQSKTWTVEEPKTEPPTDFAAIEAEITLALWNADAGTVGLNPFYPVKDPA